METLDLDMDDALELLNMVIKERDSEIRSAFGKDQGTWL